MRWCNCGKPLNASAQRNAAESKIATNTRPRFVECANMLIALRACDLSAYSARNFYRIGTLREAELIFVIRKVELLQRH